MTDDPDGAKNLTFTTSKVNESYLPQIDGCCFRTAYGTGRKLTEILNNYSKHYIIHCGCFVRGLLVVISPLALSVVFVRGLLGYRHR